MTSRFLVSVPVPQVTEQSDQGPYSDTSQSTELELSGLKLNLLSIHLGKDLWNMAWSQIGEDSLLLGFAEALSHFHLLSLFHFRK